jgi:hypothetical protein
MPQNLLWIARLSAAEKVAVAGLRGDVTEITLDDQERLTGLVAALNQADLTVGPQSRPTLTGGEMTMLEWLARCQRKEGEDITANARLREAVIWYAEFLGKAGANLSFHILARRAKSTSGRSDDAGRLLMTKSAVTRSHRLLPNQIKILELIDAHGSMTSADLRAAGIPRAPLTSLLKRNLLQRPRAGQYATSAHGKEALAIVSTGRA